ncbi:MAG: signal peptide peptidase SppA [Candidatus Eisenbacteria bacterium]|nr:signal peptide peptidase SppA [Candidatus Eisenbacteria bacterium]
MGFCVFGAPALLVMLALAAAPPPAARAQDATADIAPAILTADLDGPRALFGNPALLAAPDGGRWDLRGVFSGGGLRRGVFASGGGGAALGYAYDGAPRVPRSELRLGGSLGGPAAGAGYVFRSLRESVRGPGIGTGFDVGLFARPAPQLSVSWVLRNAGAAEGLERRHQLFGLSARPVGPRLTLGAELAWDEGGYRTNRYRLGARAVPAPWLELAAAYQPRRQERGAHVTLGVSLRGPRGDLHAAVRSGSGGVAAEQSVGVTGRERRLAGAPAALARRGPVVIDVSGPLGEEEAGFSLLGGGGHALPRVLRRLREAEEDPGVTGVLLRVGPLGRGFLGPLTASGDELRDALRRVRATGKPVVAYLAVEMTGPAEMCVAAACDRVVAPRLSTVAGLGVAMEVRRLRGTYEKLGIRWDAAVAGDYKSSFHSAYTDSATPAQRAGIDSLVRTEYALLVRVLAEGRRLPADSVLAWCDGRGFTSAEARARGLLDRLGWEEDARAELNRLCGRDSAAAIPGIRPREVEDSRWGLVPAVAVVRAEGGITSGRDASDPLWGGSTLGGLSLAARLERAAAVPGVRALVLRVNSGGGSAMGSDRVRATLERIRRERRIPVVVSMGDMAASGGYLMSAPADEIVAQPMTVTGSIGVIWTVPNFAGTYDKLDARREVYKQGEHADAALYGRPLTPGERADLQHLVDDTYEDFLGVVAAGRRMAPERVRALAGGRVWWGVDAVRLGLADRLGGLREAVDAAARRAGLEPGYRVIEVPRAGGGLLSRLLGRAALEMTGRASARGGDAAGD